MRKFVTLLAAVLSGCAGSEFTYAGLTYDIDDQAFYGIAKTQSVNMPQTGSAAMSGKYQSVTRSGSSLTNDNGDAQLDVNFGSKSVSLLLFGKLQVALHGGTISGSSFSRTGGMDFWGDFYGSNAGVAAGLFSNIGLLQVDGVSGQFIVAK